MLYLGCDHGGFVLKEEIKKELTRLGIENEDTSPNQIEGDDYPEVAKNLAEKLKKNPRNKGIAICSTGQGICIALNRHGWIRAGFGQKRDIVRLLRQHNDGNVLCLAGSYTNTVKAVKLIKIFLNTPFSKEERHQRRVDQLG